MFSHHQLSPSLHSSLAAALVHAGDDVGAEGGGGGGGEAAEEGGEAERVGGGEVEPREMASRWKRGRLRGSEWV